MTQIEECEPLTSRDNPNIKVWLKQLKEMHAHIPENLLLHILKTYDANPQLIDELVEEDKTCPIKPKERPEVQGTYNTVEVIRNNDDEKNESIL